MKKKVNIICLNAFLIILLTGFSVNTTNAQHKHRHKKHKTVVHKKNKTVVVKKHKKVVVKTYKTLPRWKSTIKVVPAKAIVATHNRIKYRIHNGIFYKPSGNSFVVITPPAGIRINTLPANRYRFVHKKRTYYYYYGAYYAPVSRGGYKVIKAPVGAKVDTLPEGYEIVESGGSVYYKIDTVYYKAIAVTDGNVMYEVVNMS